MRGLRGRLAITLVVLVAVTATVLGVGAYTFVDLRLRERLIDEARGQANFDLAVLAPARLPPSPGEADIVALADTIRLRGGVEVIVDRGDGDPYFSAPDLVGLPASLSPEIVAIVDRGELGYEWTSAAGRPVLAMAGRMPDGGPIFTFVFDATAIEVALGQLRLALVGGGLLLAIVALLLARAVARGILRPVEQASRAAAAIERGDLSARVPITSNDEFGDWARSFNRMAQALEATFDRLRASQEQNRRFVADVSHELRTPLTALVGAASLLGGRLDVLPPDMRRPAELLITDVARLRALVDDLMELSRFDAAAERVHAEPVDLGRRLEAIVAARHPEAVLRLPADRVIIDTDPRRIDRIVGNLLDNARQHAPGAPVEVSLAGEPGLAVVTVADRGPGVATADFDRLFERFSTADPSRHGGSGLGLAIAAEHAALLGATLRAEPGPGDGLRFVLGLPVAGSLPARDGAVIPAADDRGRITRPEETTR